MEPLPSLCFEGYHFASWDIQHRTDEKLSTPTCSEQNTHSEKERARMLNDLGSTVGNSVATTVMKRCQQSGMKKRFTHLSVDLNAVGIDAPNLAITSRKNSDSGPKVFDSGPSSGPSSVKEGFVKSAWGTAIPEAVTIGCSVRRPAVACPTFSVSSGGSSQLVEGTPTGSVASPSKNLARAYESADNSSPVFEMHFNEGLVVGTEAERVIKESAEESEKAQAADNVQASQLVSQQNDKLVSFITPSTEWELEDGAAAVHQSNVIQSGESECPSSGQSEPYRNTHLLCTACDRSSSNRIVVNASSNPESHYLHHRRANSHIDFDLFHCKCLSLSAA